MSYFSSLGALTPEESLNLQVQAVAQWFPPGTDVAAMVKACGVGQQWSQAVAQACYEKQTGKKGSYGAADFRWASQKTPTPWAKYALIGGGAAFGLLLLVFLVRR